MTIFDDIFAGSNGVAATLLGLFGTTATVTYGDNTASINPVTQVVTPGATVTETVDASPPEPFTTKEREGTVILETDLKTIIREDQLTGGDPPVGATVTLSSQTYRVIWVAPIQSGDLIAAYTLALRK
jgi:hypothetical protein